jgi:hypothetical protein
VIAKDSKCVSVLLGNANGTFAARVEWPIGLRAFTLATGDFDGDGHADVAVASSSSANTVLVLYGNGTGQLSEPVAIAVGTSPEPLAVADVDGNGIVDVVVGNQLSNDVSVLLGPLR